MGIRADSFPFNRRAVPPFSLYLEASEKGFIFCVGVSPSPNSKFERPVRKETVRNLPRQRHWMMKGHKSVPSFYRLNRMHQRFCMQGGRKMKPFIRCALVIPLLLGWGAAKPSGAIAPKTWTAVGVMEPLKETPSARNLNRAAQDLLSQANRLDYGLTRAKADLKRQGTYQASWPAVIANARQYARQTIGTDLRDLNQEAIVRRSLKLNEHIGNLNRIVGRIEGHVQAEPTHDDVSGAPRSGNGTGPLSLAPQGTAASVPSAPLPALNDRAASDAPSTRRSVMVVIPEVHIQRRVVDPAGETAVTKAILRAGYRMIDERQAKEIREKEDVIEAIHRKDDLILSRLLSKYDADVLVYGEAFSSRADIQPDPAVTLCRGRIEMRAVSMKSAEILAISGEQATGRDIDELTGGKRAIENAADIALQEFVPQLLSRLPVGLAEAPALPSARSAPTSDSSGTQAAPAGGLGASCAEPQSPYSIAVYDANEFHAYRNDRMEEIAGQTLSTALGRQAPGITVMNRIDRRALTVEQQAELEGILRGRARSDSRPPVSARYVGYVILLGADAKKAGGLGGILNGIGGGVGQVRVRVAVRVTDTCTGANLADVEGSATKTRSVLGGIGGIGGGGSEDASADDRALSSAIENAVKGVCARLRVPYHSNGQKATYRVVESESADRIVIELTPGHSARAGDRLVAYRTEQLGGDVLRGDKLCELEVTFASADSVKCLAKVKGNASDSPNLLSSLASAILEPAKR
jgi:hypothetical protein